MAAAHSQLISFVKPNMRRSQQQRCRQNTAAAVVVVAGLDPASTDGFSTANPKLFTAYKILKFHLLYRIFIPGNKYEIFLRSSWVVRLYTTTMTTMMTAVPTACFFLLLILQLLILLFVKTSDKNHVPTFFKAICDSHRLPQWAVAQ